MFTATLTVVQSATGAATFTDASVYEDEPLGDFLNRELKLWRSDGTLYGDAPIAWPYNTDSLTITLDRDYAFKAEMIVTPEAPQPGSSYVDSSYVVLKAFAQSFRYQLIQGEAANPNIVNKANYITNKMAVFTYVASAEIAISYKDISNAQMALDRVNHIIKNKSLFF